MEKKLEAQKELDAESMTTVSVNVKEYAPSEAFSAEPPPAYQRPKSTAVQVARIAAVTVVLVSFILGSFIFAAAWVQANSACQDALNEQLARMDQMLEDRAAMGPQYQALVGDPQGDGGDADQQPQSASQSASQHAKREEPRGNDKDDRDDDNQENAVDPPIHLKLPLQLDFDELAGALMERNQRSRMNCVVEKRRAEEVVDHQPRTVRLPFGLNLTTDPRYEHVSGERMAIFCESGHDQRHVPMDQMGGPIVVPVQQNGPMGPMGPMGQMGPGPMQPTHQQLQQQMQQQHQQQMQQQLQQQIQMHLQQLHQQQMQRQHEQQMQQQQQQQQFGPPPPQHMPIQVLPMSQAEARGFQQHTPLVVMHASHASQQPQPQSPRQGRHFFPNDEPEQPELVNLAPAPRGRGFQGQGIPIELRGVPVQAAMAVEVEGRGEPLEVEGRSLTPQQLQQLEHLHQLQQLQPQDGSGPQILPVEVIEARAFQHPHDVQPQPQGPPAPLPADTLRPPYQRTPIHAVPPQEEEPRPHFVQPRSVRSVDALLHREKRVRRCACDCNC